MHDVRLAIVTNCAVGWTTVRKRWERDLSEYRPMLFHIEDYRRRIMAFTQRHGGKSVGQALAGRAAVQAAIGAGANVVLLSTVLNAPLLPANTGVKYLIYGDATTSQLSQLYGSGKVGFLGSLMAKQLRRMINDQSFFLCMSDWYQDALRTELDIPKDQLIRLAFYVDTEKWYPVPHRKRGDGFKVLFIGGDLQRKGGDIVYAIAAMERFRDVEFHMVSPLAESTTPNVVVHRDLGPESDALVRLVQSSDVMVLPTRADASSIAALECAACRVPSIITRVGGTPEIVLDQVTGSILPYADVNLFADELEGYRKDPALVTVRGENARKHVERNFSRIRHLNALRALIDAALPSDLDNGVDPPSGRFLSLSSIT